MFRVVIFILSEVLKSSMHDYYLPYPPVLASTQLCNLVYLFVCLLLNLCPKSYILQIVHVKAIAASTQLYAFILILGCVLDFKRHIA